MVFKVILGGLLGSSAGYGSYRMLGPVTGTYLLTSHPALSTLLGAMIGLLLMAVL